jgi:hypothetical protein
VGGDENIVCSAPGRVCGLEERALNIGDSFDTMASETGERSWGNSKEADDVSAATAKGARGEWCNVRDATTTASFT